MKEAALQAYLTHQVRLLGGMAFKLAPTAKGMPDLLVVLPGGQMQLVELKTDTGQLSEAQRLMHTRIAELGVVVHVLRGRDQVHAWLRSLYLMADDERRSRGRR